ncbi:DUF4389 domain-containing protein [Marinomonas posidonica]|uniref:DUF4389 domain-containing protein n=1 Tax=Marinomonas posidonica TaxID=936476 RepID=UPI0037365284
MSKPGYAKQDFWFRLIFMVFYWFVLNLALTVFGILVVLVSLVKLGSKHEPVTLAYWLTNASAFIGQIFAYLSYADEEKPFPFQPWPPVNSDDEA